MHIRLDRQASAPLYVQIRNQIRQLITTKQLVVGERLPSERALAAQLDVNRSTVISAYRDLAAEGLVSGHIGRGTVVIDLPKQRIDGDLIEGLIAWGERLAPFGAHLNSIALVEPFAASHAPEGAISFSASESAPELYPLDAITQAFQNIIETRRAEAFRVSPAEGRVELRTIVARQLSSADVVIDPAQVAIMSGRNQAWTRLAQILLQPGDVVISEIPAPLLPIATWRSAGAQIVGVPIDDEGMQIPRLEYVLARCRPKFIITMPTFQTPSGVTMSLDRRQELLAVVHRHRVPVVELEMFSEMWYDTPPPPPLITLDRTGSVIHVGSWGSFLLPGLQVGWLVGPTAVIENVVAQTQLNDSGAATICQLLLASIFDMGLLPEYLATVRQEYRRRFEAMVRAIDDWWPPGTTYTTPHGGKQIWVCLPAGLPAERLLAQATNINVFFRPGRVFQIGTDRGREWILLNFAETPAEDVYEGMKRLGVAARSLLANRSTPKRLPPDRAVAASG